MSEAPPTLDVRVDAGGATGGVVWNAAHVMADVLADRDRAAGRDGAKQLILELGCGTGYLALRLASASRRTRVIATDVAERMRLVQYNAGKNQLRHAVRAVAWDWRADPPSLEWGEITRCVACEVVYYDEYPEGLAALASALNVVFERCRPGIEVLMMVRVRIQEGDVESSAMVPSDSYDERSSVYTFIETTLPAHGLRAERLSLHEHGEKSTARGLRFYQVHPLEPKGGAPSASLPTAPVISPEERRAVAEQLHTAWGRVSVLRS